MAWYPLFVHSSRQVTKETSGMFKLGLQRLSVLSGYPTVQYVSGFKYLRGHNLVPRPISVSGNKAAGREARVKNSNRASSAAESQKRAMAYRKRTSPILRATNCDETQWQRRKTSAECSLYPATR